MHPRGHPFAHIQRAREAFPSRHIGVGYIAERTDWEICREYLGTRRRAARLPADCQKTAIWWRKYIERGAGLWTSLSGSSFVWSRTEAQPRRMPRIHFYNYEVDSRSRRYRYQNVALNEMIDFWWFGQNQLLQSEADSARARKEERRALPRSAPSIMVSKCSVKQPPGMFQRKLSQR